MTKRKFKFKQEIKVKAYITRQFHAYKANNRVWVREEFEKPIQAIFLLHINLSNGKIESEWHEEGGQEVYFVPEEYIKGAWICQENHAPIKVLLDDIEAID